MFYENESPKEKSVEWKLKRRRKLMLSILGFRINDPWTFNDFGIYEERQWWTNKRKQKERSFPLS